MSQVIKKYIVIQGEDLNDFTGNIETHMKDGWKLTGGVAIFENGEWYYQAMYQDYIEM